MNSEKRLRPTPKDYLCPDWDNARLCHDWKNHASDDMQSIWHTFNDDQKRIIADVLDDLAGNEEWRF